MVDKGAFCFVTVRNDSVIPQFTFHTRNIPSMTLTDVGGVHYCLCAVFGSIGAFCFLTASTCSEIPLFSTKHNIRHN